MALIPSSVFVRLDALHVRCMVIRLPEGLATGTSLVMLAGVVALVVAGVEGSRDPLANPLPLFVWAVWWIGFTYLHAALGNWWAHVNPWIGLHRLLTSGGPLATWGRRPPLRYPPRAASWPAVAGLALFAWFELIYPAPLDPATLAGVVAGYVLGHVLAVLLFGPEWLGRAETFSVFFRMVSRVSPFALRSSGLEVTAPALNLLRAEAFDASGVAFALLVLSAVSFDGLSRTFSWLALVGVNPLAYPGRTALMLPNTLGLLGAFAVLGGAFVGAVALGAQLGGLRAGPGRLLGVFALAMVPIVCGYHFAHYLPVFLVDVQWALRAASDPFARGWNLLGTGGLHVVTSFLSDSARVYAVWHAQVGLIVAAHVAGVVVAHALAVRHTARRTVVAGQLPLLLLMIGYTVLGLWLLSTPSAG
ncbi:MAG TPA: hypothetical protein VFV05_24850 [Methylomirabilota bacterium]|nr:hypothetical protein [Methylomirabilota bacterium]